MISVGIDFEFNLEFFLHECSLQKVSKLGPMQFELFENARMQLNSVLNEKIRI